MLVQADSGLAAMYPRPCGSIPFVSARREGTDQVSLCIDEDSGLIVDADASPDTSKFFERDGSPSAALKAIWQFVQQIEQARVVTNLAVAALAECRVIAPWPLTVHDGNQQVAISGLFQIDEAALNALDDETFRKLRKASALVIGVCATRIDAYHKRLSPTRNASTAAGTKSKATAVGIVPVSSGRRRDDTVQLSKASAIWRSPDGVVKSAPN